MDAAAAKSRDAFLQIQSLPGREKNKILECLKTQLRARQSVIETANAEDLASAKEQVDEGKLSQSLFARLDISGAKFEKLIIGIDQIIALDDPVGKVTYANQMAPGLNLYRTTCPIGVLAVIFEARPDAAVQIGALALKSGNAVLLKGGKEAARSNAAIVHTFQAALEEAGHPKEAIQNIDTREDVAQLLKMDKYVDLVIPRGSNELVRYIKNNTTIPVLGHADGICAVYVDKAADMDKALKIVIDSKTHYPAACNAMETLLVHQDVVSIFLPGLKHMSGVSFVADPQSIEHLPDARTNAASEDDFVTEFLSLKCAIKVVSSLEEACAHINSHGSHHTDCIVSEDPQAQEAFCQRVDSAGVFVNASTRFADGFRFGFGAEVGISTNRIHARGPVGLDGLCLYKYRLYGNGQGAGDFDTAPYMHKPIEGIHGIEDIPERK